MKPRHILFSFIGVAIFSLVFVGTNRVLANERLDLTPLVDRLLEERLTLEILQTQREQQAIVHEMNPENLGLSGNIAVPYTNTTTAGAATTSQFFGNLEPQLTNQYDLGSPDRRWDDIYGRTASISGAITVGSCTGCGAGGASSNNITGPFSVTDGLTTSTMTANSLSIATSTANMLGLFNVDSSGNVNASGTFSNAFGQAVSSTFGRFMNMNVSGTLQMAAISTPVNVIWATGNGIELTFSTSNGSVRFAPDSYATFGGTTDATRARFVFRSTHNPDPLILGLSTASRLFEIMDSGDDGATVNISGQPDPTIAILTNAAAAGGDNRYLGLSMHTSSTGGEIWTGANNLSINSASSTFFYSSLTNRAGTVSVSTSGDIFTSGTLSVASSTLNAASVTTSGAVYMNGLSASGDTLTDLCLNAANEVVRASTGSTCLSSSRRVKNSIENLELSSGMSALEMIAKLQPRQFKYNGKDTEEIGLIAEEVEEVEPRLVAYDEHGVPAGVKYEQSTALLFQGVQELDKRVQIVEETKGIIKPKVSFKDIGFGLILLMLVGERIYDRRKKKL